MSFSFHFIIDFSRNVLDNWRAFSYFFGFWMDFGKFIRDKVIFVVNFSNVFSLVACIKSLYGDVRACICFSPFQPIFPISFQIWDFGWTLWNFHLTFSFILCCYQQSWISMSSSRVMYVRVFGLWHAKGRDFRLSIPFCAIWLKTRIGSPSKSKWLKITTPPCSRQFWINVPTIVHKYI